VIISYSNPFSILDRFRIQAPTFGRFSIHTFSNNLDILVILVFSAKKMFIFDFEPNISDFDLRYFSESVICEDFLSIFIPDDNIIP